MYDRGGLLGVWGTPGPCTLFRAGIAAGASVVGAVRLLTDVRMCTCVCIFGSGGVRIGNRSAALYYRNLHQGVEAKGCPYVRYGGCIVVLR